MNPNMKQRIEDTKTMDRALLLHYLAMRILREKRSKKVEVSK